MKTAIAIIVILVLVGLGAWWYLGRGTAPTPPTSQGQATTTPNTQTVTTPDGVSFAYGDPYGLAVTPEQVTVSAYIPPCAEGFDYCLYRTGDRFSDTNFESAGLAIEKREDLTNQNACLTSAPAGYTNLDPKTTNGTYPTSVFTPLGDAAAGHYASGSQYRLWTGSTCYQFETRIGETQYANYPEGTKVRFTEADRAGVLGELQMLLASVTVNGTSVSFPQ